MRTARAIACICIALSTRLHVTARSVGSCKLHGCVLRDKFLHRSRKRLDGGIAVLDVNSRPASSPQPYHDRLLFCRTLPFQASKTVTRVPPRQMNLDRFLLVPSPDISS